VDSMGNLDNMLEEDDDDLEVCVCSQTYLDSLCSAVTGNDKDFLR
jgi:hypothetical protein